MCGLQVQDLLTQMVRAGAAGRRAAGSGRKPTLVESCASIAPHALRGARALQEQRFKGMSDTIIGRIDDMGRRVEELEKSINELMVTTQAAATTTEGQPGGGATGGADAAGGSR